MYQEWFKLFKKIKEGGNINKKQKEIENEYLKELDKYVKLIGDDNGALHIYCDEIILGFLRTLGYNKIVNKYEQIRGKNIF